MAVEPGRELILLLAVIGVFPTRLARSDQKQNKWQARRSITYRGGTHRGAWWKDSACPPRPAHTSNQPIEQGSQPLVEWLMLKVGRGGGVTGVKRVRRVSEDGNSWGIVRARILRDTHHGVMLLVKS